MNISELSKKSFKKTLVSRLIAASFVLSSVGHASDDCGVSPQPDDQEIPEITLIDFSELTGVDEQTGETLFIDVDSDEFVLSQSEWYLIQTYVHSALALPTTEVSMKSALNFEDGVEFSTDYQALLNEYIDINNTANDWNGSLYPSIVELALSLSNYSSIHTTFFTPLVNTLNTMMVNIENADFDAAESNVNTAINYLNLLKLFSDSRLAEVETAKSDLITFSQKIHDQSANLDTLEVTFSELLSQDNTQDLRNEIDDLNNDLQDINDEIADKKDAVALTAIGGGLSLLIGGSILGAQIENLKDDADDIKDDIRDLEGQLAHAISLYQSYENANISIENISSKIDDAIPHIDKLKLHWQDMRKKFDDLSTQLTAASSECGLRNINISDGTFSASFLIDAANQNWATISNLAQEFAQNAYVMSE